MLNGVCGYENHIEYMERSLAVVDRMEKLVKELLYVSKAEGTQESEYKTVDFAEIFRVLLAKHLIEMLTFIGRKETAS